MSISKLINIQDYLLSNSVEYFEMIVYSAASFFIPFLIGHPQIAVGIVVNAMLITSALNLKGWKVLPIIILPSVAMLFRGALFGGFTMFLIYLIPFIWIGNALLVFSFKYFRLRLNKNYWLTLIIGALLKSGFLFIASLALYLLGIIPLFFLISMGVIQLITALLGGAAAFGIHSLKKVLC